MSNNVFQFVDVQRVDPDKKRLKIRKVDFVEIYKPFTRNQAKMQAGRCLECGNPYCEWKCPVHNYIPDWLKLVEEGRIIEAAELVTKLTACLRFVVEFAHKIVYVKAIVL